MESGGFQGLTSWKRQHVENGDSETAAILPLLAFSRKHCEFFKGIQDLFAFWQPITVAPTCYFLLPSCGIQFYL